MKYSNARIIFKNSRANKHFARKLLEWGKKNVRKFPWRENNSPYEIFIAEVLLKRTTSTAVRKVYQNFLSKFPTIFILFNSSLEEIKASIKTLGLYNQRANGLKKASQKIIENFNGKIPDKYEDLMSIPNIGEYSARAILSFGFNKAEIIIDSNVRRIICRVIGNSKYWQCKDEEIKNFLKNIIPNKEHILFNWSLLDFGSLICLYKYEKCFSCPLKEICNFYRKKIVNVKN